MDKIQCASCGKWIARRKRPDRLGRMFNPHECSPCPVDVLQGILGLVDVAVTLETIEGWTVDQRNEAQKWAGKLHMRAADNIVRVPPRPDFLPDPASRETAGIW